MSQTTVIKNARIVNENKIIEGDLLIKGDRIEKIGGTINYPNSTELNGEGLYLIPGVIDDQVHFREPGLTYKADIASESAAAVAGGVTSFMEMPNTKPAAVTNKLLEEKYAIAAQTAFANYSFFIGASNDNLDELLRIDPKEVCGIKIFMGSSTGDLLVDKVKSLENIFKQAHTLIATHCEDELSVRKNLEMARFKWNDEIPPYYHPIIRDAEECYLSSSYAISLAKKHNSRLHILHISSEKEVPLFNNKIPLKEKRITAEVCVHHLFFNDNWYEKKGNQIKCNPAIKTENDRQGIWRGLLDNHLDIIATDHAPHSWEEKQETYLNAPAGLPLVQHSLPIMMNFVNLGYLTIEKMVEKMCHAPADCFKLKERGYIREGYFADLVLVDLHKENKISNQDVMYKCGWTPLDGETLIGTVAHTFVNGFHAFKNGELVKPPVCRLQFSEQ